MARSDLIVNLAKAGAHGDRNLLRKTMEALIAEERAKRHNVLASRLEEVLRNGASRSVETLRSNSNHEQANGLHFEVSPQFCLEDLILPNDVVQICTELVEEHHRKDLLRSHNLEPRNRVLLVGPPGNGKTSLAHALAHEIMLPLIVVRYESIIGSYLGETASRLKKLFEYVRTRSCVLFFDEFDTLGKERGDLHDTGEIKRVVSSLLLQIDDLPSHVMVVTATNHDELLDKAVWRRFQVRLQLPSPRAADVEVWFKRLESRIGEKLGYSPKTLAQKLVGFSFAEIEEFSLDILRRKVLEMPAGNLKSITKKCLAHWQGQVRPESPTKAGR